MFHFKKLRFISISCLGLIIFVCGSATEAKMIQLLKPQIEQSIPLNKAIQQRRSIRKFNSNELSISQISQLLWAAQGITDPSMNFRAAPSAGALYPLEIYLVKNDGVWHYLNKKHALDQVSKKDLRANLAKAALGQKPVAQASIDIVIAANYKKETLKYGQRGIRYTHIEVGHVAENLVLETVNLGLAGVTIGAFDDLRVKNLLQLPKTETPLYILAIGAMNHGTIKTARM
jgi:SagB-type dehydrogenase family enzyme